MYYCFKLIYVYLNEGNQFCECYSCLKMVILPHFHVVFLQYFSSNVYYLNNSIYLWNCCNQGQLSNKKGNHEVSSHYNVCMKRFTTPKKYNCNSTHSYNKKIWLDIPSYIVFPCTHITLIGQYSLVNPFIHLAMGGLFQYYSTTTYFSKKSMFSINIHKEI